MTIEPDWKRIEDAVPNLGQFITAEILDGFSKTVIEVHGQVFDKDPQQVIFDFYSGTAGAKIIRWKPRTPTGKPGHPWTSIERGEPAAAPPAQPVGQGSGTPETDAEVVVMDANEHGEGLQVVPAEFARDLESRLQKRIAHIQAEWNKWYSNAPGTEGFELRTLRRKASTSLANNLCPDHRDKQGGKDCLACEIEHLSRQLGEVRATDIAEAQRAGNNLYRAIWEKLEPMFGEDSRDLDWDVLPSTIGRIVREHMDQQVQISALRASAENARKDGELIDWMQKVVQNNRGRAFPPDLNICGPGNHGGPDDHWLVTLESSDQVKNFVEESAPTLREALQKAHAAALPCLTSEGGA